MVLESTNGPYAIEGLSHLLALEMPKLCEYMTLEGKASSTASHVGSFPSLVLPSNHVTEHATPTMVVTQSIAKMLSRHKMGALADTVSLANNDYCCPSSMLRALIEVWSPSTNTFLTSVGEVGISLLKMRDIFGLSIRGAYYEEVIPSYKELTEDLPPYCLLLFKAFTTIVQRENSERVTYADWLDFWSNRNPPYVDPLTSKRYLDMSELKYDGNRNVISVPKLDRPLKWTFGYERKLRGVPKQWDHLGMLDVALEIGKNLLESELSKLQPKWQSVLPTAWFFLSWHASIVDLDN
ncbi:hypothetical protein SLEP1_g25562 [Rubroshorea leprosula]|uniref:Aminotransferase-like plant mobile domain-containing protein n=1 Tax=Rubroshorea leprosula TaxID=152421 RepID=A0AAV5JJH2_9ROSI|nr:hypothetical protein SLEP1_g25562 [Rubroshorea leprosula]